MESTIFRKKTLDRISSPEQLSDYLRVTSPGIWVILSAVVILLVGIIVWSAVGVLETKIDAKVTVQDGKAKIVIVGSDSTEIKTGMTLRVASDEFIISDIETDEYGRSIAYASVSVPDGNYDAEVVTEEVHPISFLLESR